MQLLRVPPILQQAAASASPPLVFVLTLLLLLLQVQGSLFCEVLTGLTAGCIKQHPLLQSQLQGS